MSFFRARLRSRQGSAPTIREVESDLTASFTEAWSAAESLNLALGSSGTHPLSDYRETVVTRSPRYDQLIDRNQWIIRRMAVYGMHIHIGLQSGEECIDYNYFFMHLLPHIMTLSASSPFWQGKDTGLSAWRPTTYAALPTAGMPYLVKDWDSFQKMYQLLIKSKAIESFKDLWWDIRPSPNYGTIELRFCDQPATLQEMLAIVSFTHLLAHWFRDKKSQWSRSHAPMKQWIVRENKWRTLRFGLDAQIVYTTTGKTKSLRTDILDWIKKLEPYARELRYEDQLLMVRELAMKGNSSQRQRSVFQKTNDVSAVLKHNADEFRNGHPDWLV